MASKILSVPPEVTVPQIESSVFFAESMFEVISMISASNLEALGQRSECKGLLWDVRE